MLSLRKMPTSANEGTHGIQLYVRPIKLAIACTWARYSCMPGIGFHSICFELGVSHILTFEDIHERVGIVSDEVDERFERVVEIETKAFVASGVEKAERRCL